MNRITISITEQLDGRTVAQVLRSVFSMSERRISRLKRVPYGILLNGREVYTVERVKKGDTLSAVTDDISGTREIEPVSVPLDIRYEDDCFLVVNKPAGISVHPTVDPLEVTLEHALAAHLGMKRVVHPVSRLDRGTSGLMTVAKSGYVHELFKKQMQKGMIRKEYRGIIHGVIDPPSGTIDASIASSAESHFKREVVREGGKPAKTGYETLTTSGDYSLLRLIPYTGRTHQLRVHLSYAGHPLVGDFLYGTEERDVIGRPALHSFRLELLHPITNREIVLECRIPGDMEALLHG